MYKIEHKAPQYIDEAVYGLCEINRDKVKDARIVANPGCYTTCSILTAYPLAKEGLIDFIPLFVNLHIFQTEICTEINDLCL